MNEAGQVVRGLAELPGASFEIESEIDAGATAGIVFPGAGRVNKNIVTSSTLGIAICGARTMFL